MEPQALDPLSYGIAPPGFRLPPGTSVGSVRLLVSNLQRSVEYYEQVLGLRAREASDAGAALCAAGGGEPLVTLEARAGVKRSDPGRLGLYHFAILLPDRRALGRFAAHLSARSVRAGTADHLVSEALYLRDPDGLGIEVYADRPRTTWQRRGRELAMATDPLDAAGLIAAARGEPWTGMPAGAVIGHVHLHVGSLPEAEEFYHRALGLDKVVWSYPGALFLSAGGYHHHVGTNTWGHGAAPAEDEAQLLEWELRLPSHADVAAAHRSVRDAGYRTLEAPRDALVIDPWGTPLRLMPNV